MKKITALLLLITLIISCESNEDDGGTATDNFDKSAMLQHMADEIIIPAYQDLNSKLATLKTAKNNFNNTPTQPHLITVREAWLDAYKTWQYVEMFHIGKAEELNYIFQMNIYPTNVSDIQNNISAGNYDLSNVNNNDAVGFPAVEYMIYGTGTTAGDIVDFYTINTDAAANKQYLSDLVDQMQTLTTTVLNDWTSGYRDSFINSTDNTATSALNMVVNDFIYYYEKGLRANKIGIPAGVFSSNPLPEKVEGYYSKDHSKELAQEALIAVINFFNGVPYNGTQGSLTKSLAAYTDAREAITNTTLTIPLSSRITNQLDAAYTVLQSLDNNLSQQVTTDNSRMTATYDELQMAVVLFKIDMLQVLDISVDYIDSDGD